MNKCGKVCVVAVICVVMFFGGFSIGAYIAGSTSKERTVTIEFDVEPREDRNFVEIDDEGTIRYTQKQKEANK